MEYSRERLFDCYVAEKACHSSTRLQSNYDSIWTSATMLNGHNIAVRQTI